MESAPLMELGPVWSARAFNQHASWIPRAGPAPNTPSQSLCARQPTVSGPGGAAYPHGGCPDALLAAEIKIDLALNYLR